MSYTYINKQLTGRPQAGLIAGSMLVALGMIPGLPTWPFVSIGSLMLLLAVLVRYMNQQRQAQEQAVRQEESKPEERPEDYLQTDLLEVEIGYQLVPLVDTSQGGDLIERIVQIRKQAALELGFIVPPVRVRDNVQLKPDQYQIKIKGEPIALGALEAKSLLAIDPGYAEEEIEGTQTTDPAFGLPARWIGPPLREKAELLGYNVVEPVAVLATHLTEVINSHAYELLGRQETQNLVDEFKNAYPAVVEELIPNVVPLGKLQRVLQNLLIERVSVRDLRTILEILGDYSDINDTEVLTEYTRSALRRSICNTLLKESQENNIAVLTVDGVVENLIVEGVQSTPAGLNVALAPDLASQLFQNLSNLIDQMIANGQLPVVLTAPSIRLALRKLTAADFPSLYVLSYNEIAPEVEVSSVGNLSIDYENQEVRGEEYAGSPATGA